MSKTLQEIDYGKVIWVKENGVDVEYILISKDSYSCELIRKNAVLAKRMAATNVAVYADCEMDQYLSSEDSSGFMARFDSATKSALVMRSISTYAYGDTECQYISRKCYLPSYGQCFLSEPTVLEPETTIVPELMIWKGTLDVNKARIAKDNLEASAFNWWLRSPFSATAFWGVYNIGSAGNYSATDAGVWCRPVLSVASATITGDDGAGEIHLLPVDSHREVEFEGLAGTSSERPRKALVQFTAHGLSNISVQVCNNFGDDQPVWEDATAGSEITFANQSKQTNLWQVGVHCYGDTESWQTGYFDEPTIIWRT